MGLRQFRRPAARGAMPLLTPPPATWRYPGRFTACLRHCPVLPCAANSRSRAHHSGIQDRSDRLSSESPTTNPSRRPLSLVRAPPTTAVHKTASWASPRRPRSSRHSTTTKRDTSEMYTTSFAFFEAIWEAGVTHCFVNLGSDHPSIIEAMVKGQKEQRGSFPRIITCPNEVRLGC